MQHSSLRLNGKMEGPGCVTILVACNDMQGMYCKGVLPFNKNIIHDASSYASSFAAEGHACMTIAQYVVPYSSCCQVSRHAIRHANSESADADLWLH